MLLDIIIILLICFGVVIGWQQGFFRFVKKILPLAGSIIVAAFLCSFVAERLFGSGIGTTLSEWVKGMFSGLGEEINSKVITVVNDKGASSIELITGNGNIPMTEILKNNGFGIVSGTIQSIIDKIATFDGTQSMAEVFIPSIAKILCYVIAFAALFFGALIVIAIMTKIFDKLLKKSVFKTIDRVLGAALWTAFFVVIIYGILGVLAFFEGETVLKPIIDYIKESNVALIMYEQNIFIELLKAIAKSFGFVK